ncbi:GNAT family N-acetyltransferase [Geomonas subterranea]|uniref:GNAT family N-acetyltransferase n=1 Tax=Geomonas subterranea TaxID=2847989 RepID=A0ABX8LNY1_9BACT|nr:MSMEG_0567/Sll0786 family nitrogen starvation N-acetyltransferase [Geomonas subterranea]QXE92656.1 GNAT family N-acetyltransferase [Geomonas subterranea]QXM09245.1 GNAT family N-acetyltransferase [Geomonas subterranea]
MHSEPSFRIEVANSSWKLSGYFQVRKEVFVNEQEIYSVTDLDDHDGDAIPLVAIMNERVVGAVRCYRKSGTLWYGGRLAVLPEYRIYNIGAMLVRKAVEVMSCHPEADRFLATVQIQNVRFFKRLGWFPLGHPIMLVGVKHQVMEHLLGREPATVRHSVDGEKTTKVRVEDHEHSTAKCQCH